MEEEVNKISEEVGKRLKKHHEARKEEQKLWRHLSSEEEAPSLFEEVQKRLNKASRIKQSSQEPLEFSDLFQRPEHSQKVKELLEGAGVTIDGIYKPNPTLVSR